MDIRFFFNITFSFLVAFFITLLPFPAFLEWLQPPWILLTLLYWAIAFPHRVGLMTAWVVGIFHDVMNGVLLGESTIPFVIVTYLGIKFALQLRMFPMGKQILAILIMLTLYQLVAFWIEGFLRQPPQTWVYWLPVITGTLFWPLVFSILRWYRRRFRIS